MAIITASNGFKIRPITESDVTFVTESLKDFPLGVMSYNKRIDELLEENISDNRLIRYWQEHIC